MGRGSKGVGSSIFVINVTVFCREIRGASRSWLIPLQIGFDLCQNSNTGLSFFSYILKLVHINPSFNKHFLSSVPGTRLKEKLEIQEGKRLRENPKEYQGWGKRRAEFLSSFLFGNLIYSLIQQIFFEYNSPPLFAVSLPQLQLSVVDHGF